MHKPLNAQNPYTYAQATYRAKSVYVCTIGLTRKNLTQTYAKAVQPTQIRKHFAIRTQTCAKTVKPTQSHIHYSNLYTNMRKIRTTYAKPHTIAQPVCYRRLPTSQRVDLKRHGTQYKIQVPKS